MMIDVNHMLASIWGRLEGPGRGIMAARVMGRPWGASGQRFMTTGTKHLHILLIDQLLGRPAFLHGLEYLCCCISTLLPAAFRKKGGPQVTTG